MVFIIAKAVNWTAQLISMALMIRAVLSFIGQDPYSGPGKAYRVFVNLTEPVVNPCRKLLARFNFNTGMFDFSVMLAFFMVEIVARLIMMILYIFL